MLKFVFVIFCLINKYRNYQRLLFMHHRFFILFIWISELMIIVYSVSWCFDICWMQKSNSKMIMSIRKISSFYARGPNRFLHRYLTYEQRTSADMFIIVLRWNRVDVNWWTMRWIATITFRETLLNKNIVTYNLLLKNIWFS